MVLARRHHPSPAREQWESVSRWNRRLQAALKDGRGEDAEDFALVLLQQCQSMQDWLKYSLRSPSPVSAQENRYAQKDVEDLFKSNELQAARIIGNGAKHLDLDDKKLNAGSWDGVIFREWDYVEEEVTLSATAKGKFNVPELCAACVEQIRGFLVKHGWALPP